MFDRASFKSYYFSNIGQSPASFNTYSSYLKRIDVVVGDLELKIGELGRDGMLAYTDTIVSEPFISQRSQCRAILNAYIDFYESDAIPDDLIEGDVAVAAVASVFSYEKELQAAVRLQIQGLEPGFLIVDSGIEANFETGRSDILARDANGTAVVIELKAGRCPKGAIEQVLGYAQDWIEKGEPKVRSMIVAGEFPPRLIAAAKQIPDLELKTYHLALQFTPA